MPRTTLLIEDDAMKVAKVHAGRHRMTLGQAVSELVRQAAERSLVTVDRNGLQGVRLNRRLPAGNALVDLPPLRQRVRLAKRNPQEDRRVDVRDHR